MKTTNKTLIAILAGIALFAFLSPTSAQNKANDNDGIAASPKVRAQLEERKAITSAPATAAMTCPKCKDEYTRITDRSARGTTKPAVYVAKHLCPGCDTTIGVTGTGKAKQNVALHKCDGCGAETVACCNPGDKTATKGMQKHFDVAPLK